MSIVIAGAMAAVVMESQRRSQDNNYNNRPPRTYSVDGKTFRTDSADGVFYAKEKFEYEQAQKILREESQTVIKDFEWIVKTNVEGLPSQSKNWFERLFGLGTGYQEGTESNTDYLQRVFDNFLIDICYATITATGYGLQLNFNSKLVNIQRDITLVKLFTPELTDKEEVVLRRKTDIHTLNLEYTGFKKNNRKVTAQNNLCGKMKFEEVFESKGIYR